MVIPDPDEGGYYTTRDIADILCMEPNSVRYWLYIKKAVSPRIVRRGRIMWSRHDLNRIHNLRNMSARERALQFNGASQQDRAR